MSTGGRRTRLTPTGNAPLRLVGSKPPRTPEDTIPGPPTTPSSSAGDSVSVDERTGVSLGEGSRDGKEDGVQVVQFTQGGGCRLPPQPPVPPFFRPRSSSCESDPVVGPGILNPYLPQTDLGDHVSHVFDPTPSCLPGLTSLTGHPPRPPRVRLRDPSSGLGRHGPDVTTGEGGPFVHRRRTVSFGRVRRHRRQPTTRDGSPEKPDLSLLFLSVGHLHTNK